MLYARQQEMSFLKSGMQAWAITIAAPANKDGDMPLAHHSQSARWPTNEISELSAMIR